MEHTSGPYVLVNDDIYGANHVIICRYVSSANASFVLRALNCHVVLLEACKIAEHRNTRGEELTEAEADKLDAAIDKAELK